MELVHLADLQLVYDTLEAVDYGVDRQYYGTMHGALTGDRLSGDLRLTNLAVGREDGINVPTLRGLLSVEDTAIWVELDGLAELREADQARVFVTSARFRTGDERYAWVNSVVAVLEGVLDTSTGEARGHLFECRAAPAASAAH